MRAQRHSVRFSTGGWLPVSWDLDHDRRFLEDELIAARAAGADVELLDEAPVEGFRSGPCLRFPRQGQFHPLKYLAGLTRALHRTGSRLYTETRAVSVTAATARKSRPTRASRSPPAPSWSRPTYRSTIASPSTRSRRRITRTPSAARVPRGAITQALYWDTDEPYHYVRLHERRGREPGGRAPHRRRRGSQGGTGVRRRGALRTTRAVDARHASPPLRTSSTAGRARSWKRRTASRSSVANPMDADNVFVATGDSGMGMTHGTIAGILITT